MTIEQINSVKGVFTKPPDNFSTRMTTGACVIGNGDLLVAVGGESDNLTLRLSKLDFWQAMDGEKQRERNDSARGGARVIGTLTLATPSLSDASYRLEQCIHDATARGQFSKGRVELFVTLWIPRGENALVVELQATGREAVAISPAFEIQRGNASATESGCAGEIVWHERRFEKENLLWKTCVTVAMRSANVGPIWIEPGQKHTLVLTVATNHETADNRQRAVAMAVSMDDTGLEEARGRHLEWWSDLWDRCAKIQIGDTYLEDSYYGSHYIMASCCGNKTFPPGLFAWITDDNPGWGSDYHANYNFQAPWWGVLTSNLVELADPYDQPILDYVPRMKAFAKRFLNVRGVYSNVGFGPKGLHVCHSITPYDGGLNFLGQKSHASFLAVNMIMRYYLTQDLDYARRYAYPYIVEVMNFWEDYLVCEDGRYVTHNDCVCECAFWHMLPDDSVEFHRAKDKNPPLSLGLIRMVTSAAIDISTALDVDAQRQEKWRHILAHISDFPLTKREGKTMFDVCENGATSLEEVNMCGIQHIYPCNAIGLSSDPALVRAGVDTILYKDLWDNYNSFSTIFAAAARVGVDPDLILQKMTIVTQKYIQPNFLFNMGGGGIENCSGIPGGLNEMLLQSHEGFLRLFPCWPKDRPARFEGLRAHGAFLVSAELVDGRIQSVRIVSEKGQTCNMANPWPDKSVRVLRTGERHETISGSHFSLTTGAGERLELTAFTTISFPGSSLGSAH
jgi:alpha-L-fucosidase 2